MSNGMKKLLGAVMFLGLAACGPGSEGGGSKLGGGKQGAASALYQASKPLSSAGGSVFPSKLVDIDNSSEVAGAGGGKATVSSSIDVNSAGDPTRVRLKQSVKYVDYSVDGKTRLNGSMTDTLEVNGTSVSIVTDGHIDLSGEVEDYIEPKTSLNLSSAGLTATSGKHSLTLNGTIVTSGSSYDYKGDVIEVDATAAIPSESSVRISR